MLHWALLNNGWIEDVGTWLLGLACASVWAHHKVVKPARERHEQLLQIHAQHTERLEKIEKDQASC